MKNLCEKIMSLGFIWATIWWSLFVFVVYVFVLRVPMLITDGMNDACPNPTQSVKEINIGKVNVGDVKIEGIKIEVRVKVKVGDVKVGDVKVGEVEVGDVEIREFKVRGKANGGTFNTKSRCFDTGIHMQAGERYRVSIDDSGPEKWKDASIPSSPEGFDNHMENYHPVMIAAMPMRRHLKDAWFVVMGKIGRHGTTFRVGKEKKVTATETGRLYLYVNDAIPPFCEATIPFTKIPVPFFS